MLLCLAEKKPRFQLKSQKTVLIKLIGTDFAILIF